jgi:hypothetical protein
VKILGNEIKGTRGQNKSKICKMPRENCNKTTKKQEKKRWNVAARAENMRKTRVSDPSLS